MNLKFWKRGPNKKELIVQLTSQISAVELYFQTVKAETDERVRVLENTIHLMREPVAPPLNPESIVCVECGNTYPSEGLLEGRDSTIVCDCGAQFECIRIGNMVYLCTRSV